MFGEGAAVLGEARPDSLPKWFGQSRGGQVALKVLDMIAEVSYVAVGSGCVDARSRTSESRET
jgi:hypothetical protein